METIERDIALKQLYDAFALLERPDPLTTYQGSHCDKEVDVFNSLNWEEATYSQMVDGMEGAIICPPRTKAYLLPRLFKMIMLRRSGKSDDAVDNLSMQLESWPIDREVDALLTEDQKKAIVAAWAYLDAHIYHPSGSHVARELAKHWKVDQ
ncbi:hypothetical protein [Boseongicola aestuarii]|uniref:Uncharacterized protein n=1 Tax=Boseongicola aestuarii TaxID=1470561 RepID=A0A238J3H2_9RHOB|nr:hypothetical protein [Boseongicola aestuarii]SMX24520.1 hypothetical protein BOA8489_02646 [Boseongicola aestuarii]